MTVAGLALAAVPLFARWLEILPLGGAASRALGLGLITSRFRLLLMTAIPTGAATLVVGPLSFVGLIAPHLARLIGLQRLMPNLYGSAALGVLVMLLVDWLGRIRLLQGPEHDRHGRRRNPRGADVVKALACGSPYVFPGGVLLGVAIGGAAAVRHAGPRRRD